MNVPPEAAEVARLLARGNSKSAVEAAKSLHKRLPTPATEALLVEAYAARARSMREHKLTAEAEALVAMVRERYPRSASLLAALEASSGTDEASLDDLLRVLADPVASAEARSRAERALRLELTDPGELASATLLPPGHPLRLGAAAIAKALAAVTSGRVDDAALALPEISHRGPLGPWKPLVRAIACFYRDEDAACERNLAAIDPESAPARLAPALRALLSRGPDGNLNQASAELVSRVGGKLTELREALRNLDSALEDGPKKSTLNIIRNTVAIAQRECPDLLPDLRMHLGVRTTALGLTPSAVVSAMGGAPRNDAQAALLFARLGETFEDAPLEACHGWELFRQAAVREGWFPAAGPETAVVFLHMAEIAGRASAAEVKSFEAGLLREILRDSPELRYNPNAGMAHLHADWLYQQSCRMDPHAEAFEKWVRWAESGAGIPAAETAAKAWCEALPHDARPLLRLMSFAEDRDAFKKALDYLRQAEALDGLNPEVRRARLRLLLRSAIRHLKQGKPRLATAEITELEALPQARENDRGAFIATLRVVVCDRQGDKAGALAAVQRARDILGSLRATSFTLAAVNTLCGVPMGVHMDSMRQSTGTWVESMARVCAMGDDLGFGFKMAEEWRPEIAQELAKPCHAPAAALEQLGRSALKQDWHDITFAATVVGLNQHPDAAARFLLLRARSLPPGHSDRLDDCLLAAIELARQRRDSALTNEIVEFWKSISFGGAPPLDEMSPKRLKKVLNREKSERVLPPSHFDDDEADDDLGDFLNDILNFHIPSPRPRRRRAKTHRASIYDGDLPF